MLFLVRQLERINEIVGEITAILSVLLVLNVFLVAFLRYAFGFGEIWMQELYVWIHATIFLAGAGYTLRHEGHVRIDLFYASANLRYRAIVNTLGCIFLGLPLVYVLGTKAWPMIVRSWQSLEKSAEVGGMPALYIFKSLILVFCVCLGIQLIVLLVRSIAILVSGPLPDAADDKGAAQ
ncbi:MAG: TRAP transporter small permease subunit [Pseudomonadota bacterium]